MHHDHEVHGRFCYDCQRWLDAPDVCLEHDHARPRITLQRAAQAGYALETVHVGGVGRATGYAGRGDGYRIEVGHRAADASLLWSSELGRWTD